MWSLHPAKNIMPPPMFIESGDNFRERSTPGVRAPKARRYWVSGMYTGERLRRPESNSSLLLARLSDSPAMTVAVGKC